MAARPYGALPRGDASSTWSGGFGGHPVVFIASKQWQEVLTGSAGIFTLSAEASLATTSQAPVTFTFRNGLPDGAVLSLPDGMTVTIPIEAFKVTEFAAMQASHPCADCAVTRPSPFNIGGLRGTWTTSVAATGQVSVSLETH